MNRALTLFAMLFLAPLAALHEADALTGKPNPNRSAGIDPDDGTAPRPDKAIPPKLIANPGGTADYYVRPRRGGDDRVSRPTRRSAVA